jgi:hypothetical protein
VAPCTLTEVESLCSREQSMPSRSRPGPPARRAADRQARLDALLLEAITALANTECCRLMCKHRGR